MDCAGLQAALNNRKSRPVLGAASRVKLFKLGKEANGPMLEDTRQLD